MSEFVDRNDHAEYDERNENRCHTP
jgi:hypothetical protein